MNLEAGVERLEETAQAPDEFDFSELSAAELVRFERLASGGGGGDAAAAAELAAPAA